MQLEGSSSFLFYVTNTTLSPGWVHMNVIPLSLCPLLFLRDEHDPRDKILFTADPSPSWFQDWD